MRSHPALRLRSAALGLGALLSACTVPPGDDDPIEPITPEVAVEQQFFVARTMFCGASGVSETGDVEAAPEEQYLLYSCAFPSNLTPAVTDLGTENFPLWDSDGSTDGTFTAFTNPLYGLVQTTYTAPTRSN